MATVSLSSPSGLGKNTRLCKLDTGKGHDFALQTFPMHWPVQSSELMNTWVNSTVKNSSVLETEEMSGCWQTIEGETLAQKSSETRQRGVSYRGASALWRTNCLMGSVETETRVGSYPMMGSPDLSSLGLTGSWTLQNAQNKEIVWCQRLAESNNDWICSFQLVL